MIDPRQKIELGALWLEGVNTSVSVESVSDRQFVWGVNVDNSRGQVSTRPGFKQVFQTADGHVQMLSHYRNAAGTDYLVLGVNGRIQVSLYPFTTFWDIGIQLDSTVPFFTHTLATRGACRVLSAPGIGERNKIATEKLIVISDGVNPPVSFDGRLCTVAGCP